MYEIFLRINMYITLSKTIQDLNPIQADVIIHVEISLVIILWKLSNEYASLSLFLRNTTMFLEN